MATRTIKSTGKCAFCGNIFVKNVISRHVNTCPARTIPTTPVGNTPVATTNNTAPNTTKKLLHLLVEGRYSPQYWLHLELAADIPLHTLDNFLRDIWLECCGHMSQFQIGDEYYVSSAAKELDAHTMNFSLAKVLAKGGSGNAKLEYEYDFGSSANLVLKVVSERLAIEVSSISDSSNNVADGNSKTTKHTRKRKKNNDDDDIILLARNEPQYYYVKYAVN